MQWRREVRGLKSGLKDDEAVVGSRLYRELDRRAQVRTLWMSVGWAQTQALEDAPHLPQIRRIIRFQMFAASARAAPTPHAAGGCAFRSAAL